jgi:hypothetical protein
MSLSRHVRTSVVDGLSTAVATRSVPFTRTILRSGPLHLQARRQFAFKIAAAQTELTRTRRDALRRGRGGRERAIAKAVAERLRVVGWSERRSPVMVMAEGVRVSVPGWAGDVIDSVPGQHDGVGGPKDAGPGRAGNALAAASPGI